MYVYGTNVWALPVTTVFIRDVASACLWILEKNNTIEKRPGEGKTQSTAIGTKCWRGKGRNTIQDLVDRGCVAEVWKRPSR